MIVRAPIAPLRPFVRSLWATEPSDSDLRPASGRERVLPTGTTSVAFVFDGPVRLYRDALDVGATGINEQMKMADRKSVV